MSDLESIPEARVVSGSEPASPKMIIAASKMWWVAATCIVLAIGITYFAMEPSGHRIQIRFDQGHGLAEGDAIRHRGIEIGRVEAVRLLPDMSGIEVSVVLENHADRIAREGSQFWIVHPKVDFDGVSGLETAIGAKYIRVLPGVGPERARSFHGLAIAPPEGAEQAGIEVVLRGDDRYGLSIGSPVTFRGVQVGRVLSSHLSPDAKHVDTMVQIVSPHDRLIHRGSKFWKTSGVDIDVSLKGVEFSAQSLATVLRGGVAFASPGPASVFENQPIESGYVFELFEKSDPAWLDSQAAMNVLHQRPPPTIEISAHWKEKQFGFTRTRSQKSLGLVIGREDDLRIAFPANLFRLKDAAIEGSFHLQAVINDQLSWDVRNSQAGTQSSSEPEWQIHWESPPVSSAKQLPRNRILSTNRIRTASEPEDCFVVREAISTGETTTLLEMIGRQQMGVQNGVWICNEAHFSQDVWQGAPVLAAKDEMCIGMLMVQSGSSAIVPWPEARGFLAKPAD